MVDLRRGRGIVFDMSTKMKQSVVEACGRNYGAMLMCAPISVQQKLHTRMIRKISGLTLREQEAYEDAGRLWWQRKGMRGPGVDW